MTATDIAGTTESADVLNYNPYLYRGYRYDSETGLYYLNSRYYDPETGRFINADGYVSTEQGQLSANMFAYCENDPINREDTDGNLWNVLIGALIGAVSQYVADVTENLMSGKSLGESLIPSKSTLVNCASAAISGGLAATGIGLIGSVAVNAALGGNVSC